MERGHYPQMFKEHIANIEQIVYIVAIRYCRQRQDGDRRVVGTPNPGHKEHDQ
jgi:hypothetical protein